MSEINIHSQSTKVGSISFNERPKHLYAERTATGFNLKIPAEIGLRSNLRDQPRLTINNIRFVLSVENDSKYLEVGRLHYDNFYSAFVTREIPSVGMVEWELMWSSTLQALLAIERCRRGKAPRLHVSFKAELCRIIICEHWQDHGRTAREKFDVCTAPERISGETSIIYPGDVWEMMIQKLLAESWDDPFLTLLPLRSLLSPKT